MTPQLFDFPSVNDQIVGALGTIVNVPLQCMLETINNAKIAWAKLKEKMHSKGIIAKLENMQLEIWTCFSSSTPFSMMITQLWDALAAIFDNTTPTQEEWLMVLFINSLSNSKYNWLQKDSMGFMMNMKTQLNISDIIEHIKAEAREARNQDVKGSTAMAAWVGPPTGSRLGKCLICNKGGHSSNKCWEKGNGVAGSTPEWWKKLKAKW